MMNCELKKGINTLTGFALKQGRGVWFVVEGGSMFPFLSPGERVLVEMCEPSELNIGDIVLYHVDDGYYSHRVMKIKRNLLLTKGDNLMYPDPWIGCEQIAGKVKKVEKGEHVWDMESTRWQRLNTFLGRLHQTAVIITSAKKSMILLKSDTLLWYLLKVNHLIVNRLERIILRG